MTLEGWKTMKIGIFHLVEWFNKGGKEDILLWPFERCFSPNWKEKEKLFYYVQNKKIPLIYIIYIYIYIFIFMLILSFYTLFFSFFLSRNYLKIISFFYFFPFNFFRSNIKKISSASLWHVSERFLIFLKAASTMSRLRSLYLTLSFI